MNATTILRIYAAACWAVGAFMFLFTLANCLHLRATSRVNPLADGPSVSVLVPARNEAKRIRPCLDSLLAQKYGNFRIIVYDDDSTDGTGEILAEYAAEHPDRFSFISGGRLEDGWYGKPHAMQRLSEAADGDFLLFTDADTVHRPDSVGRAAVLALDSGADLVSGYVRHEAEAFGEAQVVPAIYLLTMAVMPLWLIRRTRHPAISHAIGQFMFFRASSYRKAGGYEAVKGMVSEDVRMARHLKKEGGVILFADLKESVSCRMYEDYRGAITGLSKNVYDYLNKNFLVLLGATVAVPLFFFLPVLAALLPQIAQGSRVLLASSALLVTGAWALVAADRKLPWYVPFIHPLILGNVLSTAWRAFRIFLTGKAIEWKGRMVR